jgi:hypothetical protein
VLTEPLASPSSQSVIQGRESFAIMEMTQESKRNRQRSRAYPKRAGQSRDEDAVPRVTSV